MKTIDTAFEISDMQRATAESMARMAGDEFVAAADRAVKTIESTIDMLVDSGAIEMDDDDYGRLRDNLLRARAAHDRARNRADSKRSMLSTLSTLPEGIEEGEDIPPTEYGDSVFVITNYGADAWIHVECGSERGHSLYDIPAGKQLILDSRVSGFFLHGSTWVTTEEMTQKHIDELNYWEKMDQRDDFSNMGWARPGDPGYIRDDPYQDEDD